MTISHQKSYVRIGLSDSQGSLYRLITATIFPAISPAFIHPGAVKFRLPQFLVHVIMKYAKPLG